MVLGKVPQGDSSDKQGQYEERNCGKVPHQQSAPLRSGFQRKRSPSQNERMCLPARIVRGPRVRFSWIYQTLFIPRLPSCIFNSYAFPLSPARWEMNRSVPLLAWKVTSLITCEPVSNDLKSSGCHIGLVLTWFENHACHCIIPWSCSCHCCETKWM